MAQDVDDDISLVNPIDSEDPNLVEIVEGESEDDTPYTMGSIEVEGSSEETTNSVLKAPKEEGVNEEDEWGGIDEEEVIVDDYDPYLDEEGFDSDNPSDGDDIY